MTVARRPLVGVTGNRSRASRVPDLPTILLEGHIDMFLADYSEAIAAAGGIPVALTFGAEPAAVVERLDALVLSGGNDVDPRRYGRAPDEHATQLSPTRDRFELGLIAAARERGIPILGICRGCQLLNVFAGGTLRRHLPMGEGESHGALAYPLATEVHEVRFEPETVLRAVYGETTRVNSYHHQAIETPGDGVRIVGHAPDGVVEAIEIEDAPVVGVQWHPEFLAKPDPILAWLVAAAAERAVLAGDAAGRSFAGRA